MNEDELYDSCFDCRFYIDPDHNKFEVAVDSCNRDGKIKAIEVMFDNCEYLKENRRAE